MIPSGTNPSGTLVEIVEIPRHPWFVAVQFHPEFKSAPLDPHPLFRDFIGAALQRQRGANG
jgi:CTP synthase